MRKQITVVLDTDKIGVCAKAVQPRRLC